MTTWFIVALVIFGLLKIIVTSLPTSVVESFISRFELHSQLSDEETTITIKDRILQGEEKTQIINYFNDAIFVERYYAPPMNNGTPIVIVTKRGKTEICFFVYIHNEHVDVVKKYKKKVIAYKLLSRDLQKYLKTHE
ncbi:YfmQ family protein [Bacillus thuringiensis]|uniref:YfmQ family protein n=1 Tax=Bacillus thuringiensis TaxID=1428 RepID=UPI0021D69382|nr:YfmQ family protein [Bacillus thuringiensis]MCU7668017.1 YfmQ family protein [Bacillus thuringiensis]